METSEEVRLTMVGAMDFTGSPIVNPWVHFQDYNYHPGSLGSKDPEEGKKVRCWVQKTQDNKQDIPIFAERDRILSCSISKVLIRCATASLNEPSRPLSLNTH